MFQKINQLNVSITTNRTCTLKCKHCYISPELFLNKEQMSKETFLKVFDRIEELVQIDQKLEVVEWEVIGGETTMMPYEWWEEMLPIALERIAEINEKYTRDIGGLNFLTNLIYRDKRYTQLFQKYKDHPLFFLYTSWEPDTNRFGKNDKLLPRFKKVIEEIGSDRITLDLILTRSLVAMNPRDIIEEFTPLGVTDYSIKMLSPFGSGKEFFKNNMVSFDAMSDFVEKFNEVHKEMGVHKFTPRDEMLGALNSNKAFQCNGGFKYDLSIEPDGSTHFNANQTGAESAKASVALDIDDDKWALKTLFENKPEEGKRFNSSESRCFQCPYYRHCGGGWYHYRSMPSDQLAEYAQNECQGLKRIWDITYKEVGGKLDYGSIEHLDKIQNSTFKSAEPKSLKALNEIKLIELEYGKFLNEISESETIHMSARDMFNKNIFERCLAYDDLGLKFTLSELPSTTYGALTIYQSLNGNLRGASLDASVTLKFIKENLHNTQINLVAQVYDWVCEDSRLGQKINPLPIVTLIRDDRNHELIKGVLATYFNFEEIALSDKTLSKVQGQLITEKILML